MVRNVSQKYGRRVILSKCANVFAAFIDLLKDATNEDKILRIELRPDHQLDNRSGLHAVGNCYSILRFFTGFIRAARTVFSPTEKDREQGNDRDGYTLREEIFSEYSQAADPILLSTIK